MKGLYKCVRTVRLRRENWFLVDRGHLLLKALFSMLNTAEMLRSSFDCLKLNVEDKEPRGPPFLEPLFVHFKPSTTTAATALPLFLLSSFKILLLPLSLSLSILCFTISLFLHLLYFFLVFFLISFSGWATWPTLRNVSIVLDSSWNFNDEERKGKKKRKERQEGLQPCARRRTRLAKQSPNYFSRLYSTSRSICLLSTILVSLLLLLSATSLPLAEIVRRNCTKFFLFAMKMIREAEFQRTLGRTKIETRCRKFLERGFTWWRRLIF